VGLGRFEMTKKHFIELADAIRDHNRYYPEDSFTPTQIGSLASFCHEQNPNFNRQRWLSYLAGDCGPNGGAIKTPQGDRDAA
jgi:hypothetical protein